MTHRAAAACCYHQLLGHILSLCRQQLIRLSDHVGASTAAAGQGSDLHGVFHYSKLAAMYPMGREDDAPKLESMLPITPLTQQQVRIA